MIRKLNQFTKRLQKNSSENLFNEIVEKLPLGIYIYTLEDPKDPYSLRITQANKIAEEIIGTSNENMMSGRICDIFPALKKTTFPENVHAAIINNEPQFITNFHIPSDTGDNRVWTFKIIPIKDTLTAAVTFENVTAYRQEASKHALIINSVSDSIITTDLDFTIQGWNKASEEMYGWTEEEVIGKKIADILNPTFKDMSFEQVKETFFKNSYWKGESKKSKKNGEQITVMTSVTLLYDHNHNPVGCVAVNRNLTKEKDISAKLLESYKYLGIINRKMNILLNIHRNLKSKNNTEILNFLMDESSQIADTSCIALHQYDKTSKKLKIISNKNMTIEQERDLTKNINEMSDIIEPLRTNPSTIMSDFRQHHLYQTETNSEQFLLLPLILAGELHGTLLFIFDKERKIYGQERDFFEVLAMQMAHTLFSNTILK